jgi:hypothetical protein
MGVQYMSVLVVKLVIFTMDTDGVSYIFMPLCHTL